MVIFKLRRGGDAAAFCAALQEKGVLAGGLGPRVVRFVTHFDVSREGCERAAEVVEAEIGPLQPLWIWLSTRRQ